MKQSFRWHVVVFLSAVLTVAVFWPFFIKEQIPIPGPYMVSWYEPWKTDATVGGVPAIPHKPIGDDVFRQVVPFKQLAIEQLKNGEVPLWNPYNGSGQPLLATIHSAYLNPFSFLMLIGTPMQGWSWYVMAQMVLTGLVMFWFAWFVGLSMPSAVVAVITLLLSGFMTVRLEYGVYGYAMAALALLAAGVELIRIKRKAGPVVVTGATAFLLITVQPQIFTYILGFIFVYGTVRLWPDTRHILLLCVWMALGIGLAAPQLLPMFELYRLSNVTTDASRFIFDRFLLPWPHLVTLGIPNFFGNAATHNWWGRGDFVQTMLSVGLIPTFLAVYLFFRRKRDSLVSVLGWTVVITILLTLDWPFTRWFYALQLPIVSTNIPSRMYIVTTFCMSILAGLGYMRFEKDSRRTGAFVRFWALLLVIAAAAIWLWKMNAHCPDQVVTCRLSAVRNSILEMGVFTAFCIAAWFLRKRNAVFALVTAALLIATGLYTAQKNIPFSEPVYAMPEHGVLTFLNSMSPSRITGMESSVFATDFATQYRYFDTNYYDPLYIRRYGELVSYVNTGDRFAGLSRSDVNVVADATVSAELSFRRERFWDMTGTQAMVFKKTDTLCRPKDAWDSRGCDTLWEDANWQVTPRETALPRAYVVGNIVVEPDDDRLLAGLFAKDTNLASTAFIDESIEGVQGSGTETGSVDIVEYSANRVVLSASASGMAALVVLSDTYYPGWRASVDGVERAVYRVNYVFRGVIVPEGTHRIEFWYEPVSFRIGVWVMGISAGVWFVLVWVVSRKRE